MNTVDYIEIAKNRIVERFHPLRVLLFGSQARPNPPKDSDIDLLIVMSEAVDKRQTAIAIRRSLNDLPISKDIIVTTTDEIERRGDLIGTVLRPALREGTVIYERI